MKTIPILFNTEMVQALLAGRKTQTRRLKGLKEINQESEVWQYSDMVEHGKLYAAFKKSSTGVIKIIASPYGKPGDILWVKETFGHTDQLNISPDDESYGIVYKVDGQPWNDYEGWKWKSPLFMPKAACRLFLKVVSVRVERLQDISESDAVAEGCIMVDGFPERIKHKSGTGEQGFDDAVQWYQYFWEEINGAESWEQNPWVWVVQFERTKNPGNF